MSQDCGASGIPLPHLATNRNSGPITGCAPRFSPEALGTAVILLTAEVGPSEWRAYDDGTVNGIVNKALDVTALWTALEASSAGERVVAGSDRVPVQRAGTEHAEVLTARELHRRRPDA